MDSRVWLGLLLGIALLALMLAMARRRRAPAVNQPEARTLTLEAKVDTLSADTPSPARRAPTLKGRLLRTEHGHEYFVHDLVGKGSMGAVFRAAIVGEIDEPVAIKVLLHDPALVPLFAKRFEREFGVLSRLSHPGIVRVYDWGYVPTEPDVLMPFMAMEWLDGMELRKRMQAARPGGLPVAQALHWTAEILQALGAAHAAGIVHRDLKPGNIMVTAAGTIKIMDFGIVHRMDADSLASTATALGTPFYMSPEHLDSRDIGPASDIYSVGVILYEMLVGQVPFFGKTAWEILNKMMAYKIVPPTQLRPDVSPELEGVIMKMLARDIKARYASAAAVLADLDPLVKQVS